jgi:hypothetical protein
MPPRGRYALSPGGVRIVCLQERIPEANEWRLPLNFLSHSRVHFAKLERPPSAQRNWRMWEGEEAAMSCSGTTAQELNAGATFRRRESARLVDFSGRFAVVGHGKTNAHGLFARVFLGNLGGQPRHSPNNENQFAECRGESHVE